MLSFLEETILNIQKNNDDLSNCTLILPSKRAGGFLKNYLLKHTHSTQFAPSILSIEEFIETLSNLQIISSEELLVKSYQAYLDTPNIPQKESFTEYASWAMTLLNDFSEVDRYLLNPSQFFTYLSEIKTLEKWGIDKEQTTLIKNYLAFWSSLHDFYKNLNNSLNKEGRGYQGMVYRKAAEDIEHYIANNGANKHFFIGFNALNTAEQHIIQALLETGHTKVYWDIEAHFYNDPNHSASLFIRDYFKNWKYYQENGTPTLGANYDQPKKITVSETQNNMSQVKYLGTLLSSYSEEQLNKTAIVLADEALLIPVLYSLPTNVKKANVTMGATLSSFPSTAFFELLLKLHMKATDIFYYKTIIALLNHPLAQEIISEPHKIVLQISAQNRTYISLEQLYELTPPENHTTLTLLFGDWNNNALKAIETCRKLLSLVYDHSTNQSIERAVWQKLDEVFQNIEQLSASFLYLDEISTIHSLFQQLAPSASLDFEGDAYEGLQIMGVLETRVLDFENVILLSVNEGILPTGKSNASFITYDLKQQFKLPKHTEKDAVYTYHFYHLLHRSQHINLMYSNNSGGLDSGEKSRYLLQLNMEQMAQHTFTHEVITAPVGIPVKNIRKIKKTPGVMKRLQEISGRYFSPSALTSYIRNPTDFYFQRILKINETEEVEETVAYNTLGTIVHEALEHLYKPYEGLTLSVEGLLKARGEIASEVRKQFILEFKQGDFSKGKNLIIFEVAKRYVENLIDLDINELKNGNTIKILQLEAELKTKIAISELDFPVFIGGKVDRIDLYNDQIRIIDYKTGKVNSGDVEIVDWDSITLDYKYSKAFQVLTYALMARSSLSFNQMEAGVISFKNMNGGFLKFAKKDKPRATHKESNISEEILNEFSLQLKKLILEICDPSTHFIEKEL